MDKTHHRCKISQKYPKTWTKFPAAAKYPHFTPISWTKHITAAKYPENTPKTWTKFPATTKYPHFSHKTRTKSPTAAKHPGKRHKTGRKCIFTQKKVTWMSPLLPLADLRIVRWGLAVFLQHIQLGAQKGICRMLHQRI